jgi:hypothetical protein
MDAAKPSSEGKPKTTANDSGVAPKPAEGSAAPKRPEQMFVVQKSGPVPAGAADSAPKNAFQTAITQGVAAARPGAQPGQQPAGASSVQPGTPANQPSAHAAGQPAGVPAGAHPAGIQPPRPQTGTALPATVAEGGLPELAEACSAIRSRWRRWLRACRSAKPA